MSIVEEQMRVVVNRPRAWPAAWATFRFSSTIVTRLLSVMGRLLLSSQGNRVAADHRRKQEHSRQLVSLGRSPAP